MLHGEGFRYLHHREVIMDDMRAEYRAKIAAAIKAAPIDARPCYYVPTKNGWEYREKTVAKKAIKATWYHYHNRFPLDGLSVIEINGSKYETWTGGDRGPGLQRLLNRLFPGAR
jgi:hypothetical protein